MKTPNTYDQQVEPWIKAHSRRHGFTAAVTREFVRMTGKPMTRQQIGRWLHPDPEQRTEPGYGNAQWLFEAMGRAVETMKGGAK